LAEPQPTPRAVRYQWGWFAWEATVGYIYEEYSSDATLTLEMYAASGIVMWAGELSYADVRIEVRERLGVALVLGDLWQAVSDRVPLFRTPEAATRAPAGYADDQWLDPLTLDALTRLVGVTSAVFREDWRLFVYYRLAPVPQNRVQARLIAKHGAVSRAGRGATLRDGCRNLFHNATPDFRRYTGRLTLSD